MATWPDYFWSIRSMRIASWFLSSLAALSCTALASLAQARSVAECPELPTHSGLEWAHDNGDDFGLCRAIKPGEVSEWFLIYLGNAPDIYAPVIAIIDTGVIDGKKVWWYRVDPIDLSPGGQHEHPQVDRETLLLLREKNESKPALFAHVLVRQGDEAQIAASLAVLEHLHFHQTEWTAWLTPEKLKEELIPRPCPDRTNRESRPDVAYSLDCAEPWHNAKSEWQR